MPSVLTVLSQLSASPPERVEQHADRPLQPVPMLPLLELHAVTATHTTAGSATKMLATDFQELIVCLG
jgi:hypothetical protein